MRKVLLHGPCRGGGGFYPLSPSMSKFWKLVLSAIKISIDRWHNRLGHPSHDIVCRFISKNNLLCAHFDSASEFVCDACVHVQRLTNYCFPCQQVVRLLLCSLFSRIFGVLP
jgi:hypothetical protein